MPNRVTTGQPTTVLVAQARDGDEHAILSLLAVSQPDIRRFARRSCSVEDVDDAVQQALLLVYRRIGALKVISSFSGWLFAIIRHECLRLKRKQAAFPRADNGELDLIAARREDLDLRHDLARAIQSLPPHYREVLIFRDVEELSIDEIAAALTISREAVKARLNRARKFVREFVGR
jgi:RNA polymerase sigma factor (sigma-70 family)